MLAPVCAIVVVYQPELAALSRLLSALAPQVDATIVVDNGSPVDFPQWLATEFPAVDRRALGANLGVGAAQNAGIEWARTRGAAAVLLMDQDSEPASDMVARLAEAAQRQSDAGFKVAAIGPCYQDPRHQPISPFIRIERLQVLRKPCLGTDDVVTVDLLISSGCLVPLAAFAEVGPMNGELFIDYVDVEWSLRAQRLGYRSFGACAAHMKHSLGELPIPFLGRKFTVHTPLRHYYLFRNAVWLYLQPGLSLHWKLADGIRLVFKFFIYALLGQPRMQHLAMMLRGIWHGMRGRLGRFDPA